MVLDKMPVLGSGKIDYPAVQRLAEAESNGPRPRRWPDLTSEHLLGGGWQRDGKRGRRTGARLLTGFAMRWPLWSDTSRSDAMSDPYARYTRLRFDRPHPKGCASPWTMAA